ncbi:hypothetical protein CALCODRAFT_491352 [Calocera cornea HHB12733]|uniref:Uncharacterized protein n=1 Tax=Calocera cornea HHB12733 TaxID=1353952 RepID=A0A165J1W2_9BASI|nr:hypothetical protein CALCODRAFT_491352 [Calocera cornea HHB12733]
MAKKTSDLLMPFRLSNFPSKTSPVLHSARRSMHCAPGSLSSNPATTSLAACTVSMESWTSDQVSPGGSRGHECRHGPQPYFRISRAGVHLPSQLHTRLGLPASPSADQPIQASHSGKRCRGHIRPSQPNHTSRRQPEVSASGGSDCYRHGPTELVSALDKTASVRELGLNLGNWLGATGSFTLDTLPSHLPPNLEQFSFRGAPRIFADVSPRLTAAKDRTWLPALKEFSLHLHVRIEQPGGSFTGEHGL